ncbi:hypothetical protein G1K57_10345 [Tenacibaculum finnmarkense]|uniref:hypothetical protein n=1 Tax=Tenacibaculum finnmarkense TaxID=2781243 RepID=UPI001EFAF7CF|nr:hypothetical protein [Tenacibaculum finnmarkense]MCG8808457.1 hypothetical protein [Tenacibaculum finnmarkense]MCG8818777.1 hypothetical protein [Tenacibaculum finnmarkense]
MKDSTEEERKKKEKSAKILKYGCLPLIGAFFLIILLTTIGGGITIDSTGDSLDVKTDINNFCKLSVEKLTEKYGKPIISEYQKEKNYTWVLNKENNIKAVVFIDIKGNSEVVRFFNFELGTFFWDTLGWQKNNLKFDKFSGIAEISDYKNIKKAIHKTKLNILDVQIK